ncbi:MAG TPA: hypothetical protein VKI44_34155 [Acetobacteraceae bacterium]|nr:hypothetical protein [Acetobacteraceae bacterium]
MIVRGALAAVARKELARNPNATIRRIKLVKANRGAPTLEEVDRLWVMLDIDGFPLRSLDDLAEDPEGAIDHAIHELLPEPFQDSACWWQLSSSAGFAQGILKVHLFYWLTQPASNLHIKTVLKQCAPGVGWRRVLRRATALHRRAGHRGWTRPNPAPFRLARGA